MPESGGQSGKADGDEGENGDLIRVALAYLFIFSLALWWIILFSRNPLPRNSHIDICFS